MGKCEHAQQRSQSKAPQQGHGGTSPISTPPGVSSSLPHRSQQSSEPVTAAPLRR